MAPLIVLRMAHLIRSLDYSRLFAMATQWTLRLAGLQAVGSAEKIPLIF
jgi:hypothetical protein